MVEAREEPSEDSGQEGDGDLWTVALFVYFVGLIVLVAGLLVLPALY